MENDINQKILSIIKAKKAAKMADFQAVIGFSREYLNRFLRKLIAEKKVVRVGATNKVRYLRPIATWPFINWGHEANNWERRYKNIGLNEDIIFKTIKDETTILKGLPENVARILEYALTEMFNNAIDHSSSKFIETGIVRRGNMVSFWVRDHGVGIYNNIINKRHLKNEMEAVQDILKGRQSTAPSLHSGEGIFFTSKVADLLTISSERTELVVNNMVEDLAVRPSRHLKGTMVVFTVNVHSKKVLADIFNKFSFKSNGAFNATEINVRLYTIDSDFVSRSQARRLLAGLDKFKKIVLDFKDVKSVGQGFADEIFRVFKHTHSNKIVEAINTNPEIDFMIKRAKAA